jgi:SAM-dependent methyltransferase
MAVPSARGASPLGKDYFALYGPSTPGIRKADYSRNWRHFTFSLPEILRVYRKRFGREPRTFLDIGAADGSFLKKALEQGLKAKGIENSPYILARIQDRKLKALILEGNAADLIRDPKVIEPGAYDIVLECAAQYLPPRRLDPYLKNVARLCSESGMVCLLIDPKNYEGDRSGPHTGVRTFESMTWWRKKMLSFGYEKSGKDFYFFKA